MRTPAFSAALAALVISTAAHGADRPGHRPPPPPGGPLFKALDTDDDKVISAEEIANSTEALRKLDENGDGIITGEEAKLPPPPPRPEANDSDTEGGAYDQPPGGDAADETHPPRPHGPPIPPIFAVLDANRDGTISAEELSAAPTALKKLDKNGDGKLTPEELRPPGRPPGPPQEERGPRPEHGGRRR